MNNTDQIRQYLQEISAIHGRICEKICKKCKSIGHGTSCFNQQCGTMEAMGTQRTFIERVLALLPCKTCSGTRHKHRLEGEHHCRLLLCKDLSVMCADCEDYLSTDPCPDCQPKEKENE